MMRPLDHRLFLAAHDGDFAALLGALRAGAQLDCTDKQGFTPLCIAAHEGRIAVVEHLLAAGANVDRATHDGATPLFVAAQRGRAHGAVVKALLAAGASVDRPMNDGATPLLVAAQHGHFVIVEKLLAAGVKVDHPMHDGTTALCVAAQRNHLKIVEKLLASGANVDLATPGGITSLYMAAQNGHVDVVDKLMASGADLELVRIQGSSPLSAAAEHGQAATVERRLNAGASVDTVDDDYDTALICAALKSHEDVARILLDAGADPSIRNKQGATAAQLFVKHGRIAAAKLVHEHRPSPAIFLRAVARGNLDVVRRLASIPEHVRAADEQGRTSLHHAVMARSGDARQSHHNGHVPSPVRANHRETNRLEVLRLLLDANAVNIDAPDHNGSTALLLASQQNDAHGVRLLLERGARADVADNDGRTPLSAATSRDIRSLLESSLKTEETMVAEFFQDLKPTLRQGSNKQRDGQLNLHSVRDPFQRRTVSSSPQVEHQTGGSAEFESLSPTHTNGQTPVVPSGPYHAAVAESRGDISVFKSLVAKLSPDDDDVASSAVVQLRTAKTARETLNAAEYAYARGFGAVGDYLVSQMENPPSINTSKAVSVVLAQPVEAFAYVCVVDESLGDVDMCADLCELIDDDEGHALDAMIQADVEREVVGTHAWTAVELACHLGYAEVVKFMLKELCKTMPVKQKIDTLKRSTRVLVWG